MIDYFRQDGEEGIGIQLLRNFVEVESTAIEVVQSFAIQSSPFLD
jgi:hypothetical protein